MDIAGTLGIITNGITVAKTMRDIDKKYDEATYRAQMADLIDALSDAKLALLEARETISERDAEIDRLTQAFETKGHLVKAGGGYSYFSTIAGEPQGYPVCPSCLPVGRVIQLVQNGQVEFAKCPACDKPFAPVTCYIGNGDTAVDKRNRDRKAVSDAQTAKMRNRSSWLNR